jgi:hypothetical protein
MIVVLLVVFIRRRFNTKAKHALSVKSAANCTFVTASASLRRRVAKDGFVP